jgi:hypothetical protein
MKRILSIIFFTIIFIEYSYAQEKFFSLKCTRIEEPKVISVELKLSKDKVFYADYLYTNLNGEPNYRYENVVSIDENIYWYTILKNFQNNILYISANIVYPKEKKLEIVGYTITPDQWDEASKMSHKKDKGEITNAEDVKYKFQLFHKAQSEGKLATYIEAENCESDMIKLLNENSNEQ